MAVKRITQTFNNQEQKRLLMDLSVNMRTGNCPYTVKFFGALFREVSVADTQHLHSQDRIKLFPRVFCSQGDVWICMEVMDTSLDKFYDKVFKLGKTIPEPVLGKIAFAVS